MAKEFRFAVCGLGYIGRRHSLIIQEHPNMQWVAAVDTDPQKGAYALEKGVPFFNSLDELWAANIAIDVLCVCSPNGVHAQQCISGLQHQCHVVCEKPMGLLRADCEQVIYQSLQAGKQVFCVMQNRYSPPAQWLKQVISDKLLGEIYFVDVACYWNRDDRYYHNNAWKGRLNLDGGPLFTQFSHFIDLMYWIFGDIAAISANFTNVAHQHNTEFEDTGAVHFEFVAGGFGSLRYSTAVWDTNFESSITIIGQKGTIKVGGQYMNEVLYCHVKDYILPQLPESNPANDYGTYKGSANNHPLLFKNVIETLQQRDSPTTNALEGLKVVDIIERIYQSRTTLTH
jgi:UDP-N-acetyl-2-amino-2-deoxyglucuronate dehydrogenase